MGCLALTTRRGAGAALELFIAPVGIGTGTTVILDCFCSSYTATVAEDDDNEDPVVFAACVAFAFTDALVADGPGEGGGFILADAALKDPPLENEGVNLPPDDIFARIPFA